MRRIFSMAFSDEKMPSMQIYSKNSELFLKGIRQKAKEILNQEMGVLYKRSRVHYGGYSYPLKFVVFEEKNRLGYFDPSHFQIGLNKRLMYLSKTPVIYNILRHELIHFYQHVIETVPGLPHGKEFKAICERFGYGSEVSSAYANLTHLNDEIEGDLKTEQIINKVKKLLSLASSDNPHERQLATIKANNLLLKHNLLRFTENSEASLEEEEVCLLRVLESKKSSAKLKSIYEILESFYVQPVINHGKGHVYLEVIGTRVNVEMAHYLAGFLDHEFERLWNENKKSNPELKGTKAKNSFFRGISKGYLEKIKKQTQEQMSGHQLALIKQDLERQVSIAYGRLSYSRSSNSNCSASLKMGKAAGKNMTIKRGITSAKNGLQKLLNLP